MTYCVFKAIEWINYLILGCLLAFLLILHFIMYKKINRRWSFRIFKRNRVQILSLSLTMTLILFVKLTFLLDYADLVLLLFAQLFRFLIWSLTLINFMKSGMDLVNTGGRKVTLKILKVSCYIGAACFTAYAVYLVVQEKLNHIDVLSCKSKEFMVQSFFLLCIVSLFLFFAVKTHMAINRLREDQKHDPLFHGLNQSRKEAMDIVWVILVWLMVTAIEAFTYSIVLYIRRDPECNPS